MKEVWKDIKGFARLYEVSNLGRVRNKKTRLILKLIYVSYTYRIIIKTTNINVAKIVAQHFIPNPYNYTNVIHIDGNKGNLKVSNLKWGTDSQAKSNSYRLKKRISPNSKLSYKKVRLIRSSKKSNMQQLSKKFGVSVPTIKSVLKYRTWSNV
jgi:hypothetical protein